MKKRVKIDHPSVNDPNETLPTKQDVSTWLNEHGDVLYRYALKRVGNRDLAEDLVQETFLSALRAADGFEGRSKVQTWLIGILRNKIVDHMRKVSRQRNADKQADETSERRFFHDGHWQIGIKRWPADPSKSMEVQEFWQVVEVCQQKLPAKLSMAFRMRDLEEMAMADICEALDITATNLAVRLHRARILLRECLDQNWFATRRTR